MSYLGIDVGTTGCKVIAFDEEGTVLAQAYAEYPLYHPQNGWSELDAEEVYKSVLACLRKVTESIRHDPPVSIGISSQGEAVIPVDARGRALARSIVTFDTRGDEFVPLFREKLGEERFFAITGMPLSGIGTVNKILWWKKYAPSVFKEARYFLCFEDFLILRFGLPPAISFPLASRTMMFDVEKGAWSAEILDIAGIEPERLALAYPSGTPVGEVSREFAGELGWTTKVTVATGGHDQPCGALGAGVIAEGLAMDATGTVECIAPAIPHFVRGEAMWRNNLCCYHHAFPGLYTTLVYNFTGGVILRWFRDNFGEKEKEVAERLGKDAYELLLDGLPEYPTNLLVLPHFTMTGTPYFDSHSAGMVVGLSLNTTKKEFTKALLEGVSYEMKLNLALLKEAGIGVARLRAIGGGAKSPVWLQLKADIYGIPVETLSVSEAACFGAALLGRKAKEGTADFAGLINDLVRVQRVYEPDLGRAKIYEERFAVYRRLYPALKNVIQGGQAL
ncbi:MAG: FGGY family carbohydrate kinase [Candidatus Caldatribacterium sp.]|nr:FGGY family carbohydrate kinase [Candidatus Caldatribacterium sp.]MDW8081087.1 FGGY-family carbohydrate kinase [Candidatus Calescibacterium sp.]